MFKHKFGRKPAVHTPRTEASALVMNHALAAIGRPPPVSDDYITAVVKGTGSGGWQVLGNDDYGDCVEAEEGHHLMLRTANAGSIVVPTTQQVLKLYTDETGFNPTKPNTDQGTDMTSDAKYMVSTGLLGHKADQTAMVAPTNIPNLQWCIQLFGGVAFGVNLPQSAVNQFDDAKPWTVVKPDGGIAGGHDFLGVGYDGTWLYGVTWGQLVSVAPDWITTYCEEAHALIFADWIRANGNAPNGFDLAQLLADLPQIDEPTPGADRHHWHNKRKRRHEREDDTEPKP